MEVVLTVRFAGSAYKEAQCRQHRMHRWLSVLAGPVTGCEVEVGRPSMPLIVDEGYSPGSLPKVRD